VRGAAGTSTRGRQGDALLSCWKLDQAKDERTPIVFACYPPRNIAALSHLRALRPPATNEVHRQHRRIRGHSPQCHLLDSRESLNALWIARYLEQRGGAQTSPESPEAL
jgi:hypothetical protein